MSEYGAPGRVLIGTMHGFSGTATGPTTKLARRNVFQISGVYEASQVLLRNALSWDCADDCESRTGVSITPEPSFTQDPISGVWTADLDDATLKVWVECVKRLERRSLAELDADD
jgi:hypothetical protein